MAVSLKLIKIIAETSRETRPESCTYEDCTKTLFSRGLCKAHYNYYQKYIRPNYPIVGGKPHPEPDYTALVGDPCTMCGKPSRSIGLCKKHYDRHYTQKQRKEQMAMEAFLSTR